MKSDIRKGLRHLILTKIGLTITLAALLLIRPHNPSSTTMLLMVITGMGLWGFSWGVLYQMTDNF